MTHPAKTLRHALAAAAIMASASTAFAQLTPQTADMTVTGTIVPAACSASFAGNGEVDFGTIRLVDLPDNAYHSLGDRDIALSVTCSSAKRVTFSIADTQSATAIADAAMYTTLNATTANDPIYMFGLGATTVNAVATNLGAYTIQSIGPVVDGTSRARVYSANGGSTWGSYGPFLAHNAWIYTSGNGTTPVTGTAFQFPLRVTAALNYGSRLQVASDTKLNGQAVFSINYQ